MVRYETISEDGRRDLEVEDFELTNKVEGLQVSMDLCPGRCEC